MEISSTAYHSMYDTNGWQETVDPDWMLAEDIARYTGVLTLKLLDSMVIPLDLDVLGRTMMSWFTSNLLPAAIEYDCILNDYENATFSLRRAISEFEFVANEMQGAIAELVHVIGTEGRSVSEEDMERVEHYNELLRSIAKEFMYSEGLPSRTWHKNILWNTAIEDGPSNVYPHIWYALQYQCEEEMIRKAFNVTQNLIDDAWLKVYRYLD